MWRALVSLFLPGEGVHNLYDRNLILRAQEQEEAKEEDEYERDHHPEHFLEHRLFFSVSTLCEQCTDHGQNHRVSVKWCSTCNYSFWCSAFFLR
jgi:hypothetical protein